MTDKTKTKTAEPMPQGSQISNLGRAFLAHLFVCSLLTNRSPS